MAASVAPRFCNPEFYFKAWGKLIHIEDVGVDLGHVLQGQKGATPKADGANAGAFRLFAGAFSVFAGALFLGWMSAAKRSGAILGLLRVRLFFARGCASPGLVTSFREG